MPPPPSTPREPQPKRCQELLIGPSAASAYRGVGKQSSLPPEMSRRIYDTGFWRKEQLFLVERLHAPAVESRQKRSQPVAGADPGAVYCVISPWTCRYPNESQRTPPATSTSWPAPAPAAAWCMARRPTC